VVGAKWTLRLPVARDLLASRTVMRRFDPWLFSLAACCVAAAVWAGFAPLADPDLPMHLTVGEWIYTHHRVPFEEPFAWTRAGEPYYAYSWLAQLAFFATMRAFGPVGLHLMAAFIAVAIVLAGAAAGRSMGLGFSRSTILGVLSIAIAMESTPFLRPQLFMHALVPLAWASAFWFVRAGPSRRVYAALALWMASALAAGIHISFPVVAAPLVLLWARVKAGDSSRALMATAIVMLGWCTSPYALHWPAVFALNLGYNAITAGLSPAGELAPGFSVSPLVGAALATLPFLVDARSTRRLERLALGMLWLAGLVVFARYFKGLGPWWWCALPLVVMALRRLPDPSDARMDLSWAILTPCVLLAFAPTNVRLWKATRAYEGGIESRTLPSLKAFASEPAAKWLESNARIPSGTKLLTTFNYGSYLKWRLPALSESIDSRGVFPDSAALPDVPSRRRQRHVGPWRSADVAVVPVTYAVASLLDADPAWRRIGTAAAAPWAPGAPKAGLWVKQAWLRTHVVSGAVDLDSIRPMKGTGDP
jgi:hypothetical protein